MQAGAEWNNGRDNSGSSAAGRLLTRRRVIKMSAALLPSLAAIRAGLPALAQESSATPPPPAPGSGGNVVIYSGRSEKLIGDLVEQFAAASGISAKVRYGDTAELVATILEEGKNSPADLFFSQDAGALGALEDRELLTEFDESTLALVDPRFRSINGHWVGTSGRARVAVYNTDLVEAAVLPASVKGFTAPEWKNKVGWAPANGSFQSFITAFRVLEGDDAARDWLEAMKANGAVTFENNDGITRAVGEGEIPAGLVNHYYLFEIQAEEGTLPLANHYFARGDVGSLVNVAGVGILKTAANADQAKSFTLFLLGKTAQTYFAARTWEYPLITGIDGPPGVPPLTEIDSPDFDLSDLADLEGTLALLADTGLL